MESLIVSVTFPLPGHLGRSIRVLDLHLLSLSTFPCFESANMSDNEAQENQQDYERALEAIKEAAKQAKVCVSIVFCFDP